MDENELKRRQKQDLVNTANYGEDDPTSLSNSLNKVFGGNSAQQAQNSSQPKISDEAYSDAAQRNALQHKAFMLQQIAEERAKAKPVMPEPAPAPIDMQDLANQANQLADQQMYPERFQQLNSSLKKRGR